MKKNNPNSRISAASKGNRNPVVEIGCTFSVRDHHTGELDIYTLVLPENANISENRISTLTPLGMAIYGRKAGDVVQYEAPGGIVKMRIESVQIEPADGMTVEVQ